MNSITPEFPEVATEAWAALEEDPALLGWVMADARPARLAGPLPAGAVATACIRVAAAQAVLIGHGAGTRPGSGSDELPELLTDPERMAVSYSSEKVFRWNNEPLNAWAPLSGFWATADGWVRTHANYPHHRSRLLSMLGLDEETEPAALAAALLGHQALELEEAAAAVGAVVFAVREPTTWLAHEQAKAVARDPLIGIRRLPASTLRRGQDPGPLPLSGIRVLDVTRVIAGPVATRTLAYLGADVLRIDPPGLPEIIGQYLDTGQGKRSCSLDMAAVGDLARIHELLDHADVLVTGYRPGALTRFGLFTEELAATHPGLIVGRISAWGESGPWSDRRGFDSMVQAVTGISQLSRGDAASPGALPAQALDHSAGYLLAAGIMAALRRQVIDGNGREISVNLARIAHALLAGPQFTEAVAPYDPAPHTLILSGPAGRIRCAAPAFSFTGGPSNYAWGAREMNRDRPEWEHRAR